MIVFIGFFCFRFGMNYYFFSSFVFNESWKSGSTYCPLLIRFTFDSCCSTAFPTKSTMLIIAIMSPNDRMYHWTIHLINGMNRTLVFLFRLIYANLLSNSVLVILVPYRFAQLIPSSSRNLSNNSMLMFTSFREIRT